ncbi:uncharacterized protein LOC106711325 isoform X2 [Papilio machaon]|uniref:uncharacterized protein LOC106711325 isoform X1 n=1 Tax=Papilio machaon TaxID=76193 RepID=UPI001E665B37|nr:uncharacterized protein LOC106711325 isoform X1 [Papilio machaon]XP_045541351.1 uncharacterized protein LOC106711325 isoform X2 [Papilio machaon]
MDQLSYCYDEDMFMAIDAEYGPISSTQQTMYIELNSQHRSALPWYASSGCTAASAPRMVLCRETLGPVFLPFSVDQWEVLTVGRNGHDVGEALVSSILTPSLKYHMRDCRSEDKVLVINQKMNSKSVAQKAWSVDPAMYPDPPNFTFLVKQVAGANDQTSGTSNTPDVEEKKGLGPTQAAPIGQIIMPVQPKTEATSPTEESVPTETKGTAPASSGTGQEKRTIKIAENLRMSADLHATAHAGLESSVASPSPGTWESPGVNGTRLTIPVMTGRLADRGASLYSVSVDDELIKALDAIGPFKPNVDNLGSLVRFRVTVRTLVSSNAIET